MVLNLLRERVASTSLPPSVCRNILGAGGLALLRDYCGDAAFLMAASEAQDFPSFLNVHTSRLAERIAPTQICRGGVWGVARKALNIFLLEATTRDLLRRHYELGRLDANLEVPLDKGVAQGLLLDGERMRLALAPNWPKLMNVTAEVNTEFQALAMQVAEVRNVCRYQLDLFYWRRRNDDRV